MARSPNPPTQFGWPQRPRPCSRLVWCAHASSVQLEVPFSSAGASPAILNCLAWSSPLKSCYVMEIPCTKSFIPWPPAIPTSTSTSAFRNDAISRKRKQKPRYRPHMPHNLGIVISYKLAKRRSCIACGNIDVQERQKSAPKSLPSQTHALDACLSEPIDAPEVKTSSTCTPSQ